MRPPSPAIKLLHNSADAKSAVDLVISQIASNDLTTSLQALRQVVCRYSLLFWTLLSSAHSFPRQNLTNSAVNLVNYAATQMKFRGYTGEI